MPSSTALKGPRRDPLPSAYYVFFAVVEPLLTFAGAARAYFDSAQYFVELYPPKLAVAPPPQLATLHPAAAMAVRQLGSCFFLFALMACVLLPAMRRTLKSRPEELEQLVRAYLACLAAADLTHIGATLWDLGLDGARDIAAWNVLVWGNVGITAVLFTVRMMWFTGIARGSAAPAKPMSKTM
ncbi:hypothetical protein JCM8115_001623 [Rhodotorula mucilaginosa]|uniref:DUF7704 domain-containing protein n=1 Tax=Rhodotorula mucilaginosa TaxID=5537 RepID=A0A9P6VWH8_RHOMI|nr:hypothetical protein C6P46_006245 [Rhodotorula mucilaginosa]TKA55755.1 hypothetical protein B0A53_02891 [Rhodotorula sp. CCFEE 5036]